MPSFGTEVSHSLNKEEAIERLKSFVENVAAQYKDQVSKMDGGWEDNILKFSITTFGFTINGDLTVEDDTARVAGQLPFPAMPFRGKIENSIADELKKALA